MAAWFQRLFLPRIDHQRVVAAITAAEANTSGELRVVLVRHRVKDAVTEAQLEFAKLGMEKTHHRNGVLILVALRSRKFAVIGDQGVYERCGDAFWNELVLTMSDLFKSGQFTEGLVHGIGRAGELLAAHFPPTPEDGDELPNDIIERP